jgi:hypothetical protein
VLSREGRRVHSLGTLHMEKQMNDRHWFRSAGELCKRTWSFAGWVEGVGYVILADSCYVIPRSNCATNYVRDQNAETAIRGSRCHCTRRPRHLKFARVRVIHTDVICQTTSDFAALRDKSLSTQRRCGPRGFMQGSTFFRRAFQTHPFSSFYP